MKSTPTARARAEDQPSLLHRHAIDFELALAGVALALLYGQWLLSWLMLGHMPRPSVDDPKSIDGASWMHPIAAFGFLALFPTALLSVATIIWYAAAGRPRALDLAWRAAAVAVIVGLVFWDPFRVAVWWLD